MVLFDPAWSNIIWPYIVSRCAGLEARFSDPADTIHIRDARFPLIEYNIRAAPTIPENFSTDILWRTPGLSPELLNIYQGVEFYTSSLM